MLNDNNNNNKSLRSTTAILHLLRARWEILFSLGYLPTSIYLYIPTLHTYHYNNPKNGVQIQNTLNGQSKAINKMGWRAGTRQKKGSKWISLSLSLSLFTNCGNEAERFLIYIHYLGR